MNSSPRPSPSIHSPSDVRSFASVRNQAGQRAQLARTVVGAQIGDHARLGGTVELVHADTREEFVHPRLERHRQRGCVEEQRVQARQPLVDDGVVAEISQHLGMCGHEEE